MWSINNRKLFIRSNEAEILLEDFKILSDEFAISTLT
jgi:hypothetical protein